jgi:hypothetical protein
MKIEEEFENIKDTEDDDIQECVICGCSRERDDEGERICYCDTCFLDGCIRDDSLENDASDADEDENNEDCKHVEYIAGQNLNSFEASEDGDDTFGNNYDYYNMNTPPDDKYEFSKMLHSMFASHSGIHNNK